ncbi:MAG: FHA domain-containing protein [Lysobacterales bacterium]
MHLVFPHGEHDKVALGKGTFSIGAAEVCDITLAQQGLLDNHAMIAVDHRGITLLAEDGVSNITVNHRSIESKSILRLGDQLIIGDVEILLSGDSGRLNDLSGASGDVAQANREHPPKFLIRGLSGPLAGQAIALFDQIHLGADGANPVFEGTDAEASLQVEQSGVFMRNAKGIEVNGHAVSEAQLRAGDQLVAGSLRFMLEAPGFVPGKAYSGVAEEVTASGNTQVFTAPVVEPAADSSGGADEPSPAPDTQRRDALIVAVCLALSAAMVGLLIMNYLS